MWQDRNPLQLCGVAVALCLICLGGGVLLAATLDHRVPVAVGVLLGLYSLFSIKVADQWEKVAVLRLGRYRGLRGPGLFHIIPVVDTLSRYVDQRVRVSSVSAESTLTRAPCP